MPKYVITVLAPDLNAIHARLDGSVCTITESKLIEPSVPNLASYTTPREYLRTLFEQNPETTFSINDICKELDKQVSQGWGIKTSSTRKILDLMIDRGDPVKLVEPWGYRYKEPANPFPEPSFPMPPAAGEYLVQLLVGHPRGSFSIKDLYWYLRSNQVILDEPSSDNLKDWMRQLIEAGHPIQLTDKGEYRSVRAEPIKGELAE